MGKGIVREVKVEERERESLWKEEIIAIIEEHLFKTLKNIKEMQAYARAFGHNPTPLLTLTIAFSLMLTT